MSFNSGCIKSDLSGAPIYRMSNTIVMPKIFDLQGQLNPIIDQGNRGICVSACMTDIVKYIFAGYRGKKYNKNVDFYYNKRADKTVDGMTPRDACEIAVANGLVKSYALVKSMLAIKMAIMSNGPVMICLPVYDTTRPFFWRKPEGRNAIGYHAVTFVGYNDATREFILRNSWGESWEMGGYTFFPYDDVKYIREAWTIFS